MHLTYVKLVRRIVLSVHHYKDVQNFYNNFNCKPINKITLFIVNKSVEIQNFCFFNVITKLGICLMDVMISALYKMDSIALIPLWIKQALALVLSVPTKKLLQLI